MATLGQRRRNAVLECEIDMVPIMNMFLVLIPFLLASSTTLFLNGINTSVPVLAQTSEAVAQEKKSEIKITATVKLEDYQLVLQATSQELPEDKLKELDRTLPNSAGQYQYAQLALALLNIKSLYPNSDTLILIPGERIIYDRIVKTMDVARAYDGQQLFPNVVISGQVQ